VAQAAPGAVAQAAAAAEPRDLTPPRIPVLASSAGNGNRRTQSNGAQSNGAPGGAGSLVGQVRRADGAGLAGARVTITDRTGRQHGRAVTDETGSYAIPVPVPGRYLVTSGADGYQPHIAEVMSHGAALRHDATLAEAAGSTGPAPMPADEPVGPAVGMLVGTVLSATTGRPVPDALTTLTDLDGGVVASTVTGLDGQFVFDELPLGSYTLTASGLAPQSTSVQLNPGDTAAVDVRLQAPTAPTQQPRPAQTSTGS
jgi:hypothetical protein